MRRKETKKVTETTTHFNDGYSLDKKAKDIIRKFHQKHEPPYIINELAKFFDVEGVHSVEMPFNLSGKIRKTENGNYEILLNDAESFSRKRFTAAHELAHLLLHKKDIGDGINDDALYRSRLSTSQEVEANKLAVDILMPYEKVYELLDRNRRMAELPDLFEVSDVAMCIQLGVSELALLNT